MRMLTLLHWAVVDWFCFRMIGTASLQVFLAAKDVRLVSTCLQRWHRWSFRREWVVFAARLKRYVG